MSTTEIIGIVLLIPLLIAIVYVPKFFNTPNNKLNYIITKYNLKSYSADVIENLLKQDDSKVPQRDKKIIKELLKEEYSI